MSSFSSTGYMDIKTDKKNKMKDEGIIE